MGVVWPLLFCKSQRMKDSHRGRLKYSAKTHGLGKERMKNLLIMIEEVYYIKNICASFESILNVALCFNA